MNTVIEPCCYSKQLTHNLEECEKGGGVSHFFSFSDWSIAELVHWTLGSVPGCDAVLCLVQLDPRTIYTLSELLSRMYHDRTDGEDKYVVKHLTIITQTARTEPEAQRREFRAQLGRFIDEGRVTVCEDSVGYRCIVASNDKRHLVIQGSINQCNMEPVTQMFTMTTTKAAHAQAMEMLSAKRRTKKINV